MEATQTIPDVLVYEMINGQPAYYKHYRDYLEGTKSLEEIMWILSDVEKIIVATPKSDWPIVSWEKEVAMIDNFSFNLKQIISEE